MHDGFIEGPSVTIAAYCLINSIIVGDLQKNSSTTLANAEKHARG